ncbi:protein rolling stone-like isoform X2 [Venturia canescens]|uniref:protein rolling stone-like isoform X2 n=1 Tax=Venturia canescens TaxID=32260 RepID=UPI001C9BDBFD|nr:protein rolling stone-like isoform X2 [Venturia canescens]
MVVTSRKKPPSLKCLLSFILQSCTSRRAMVNKIWCRKVARAWLQAKPETPHARVFSEPKCQDHVRSWYLIYRCMILLAWLTIVVCSIFECGSVEPLGNHHKWPIYLTNWDLALGTAQASLAFWLVLRRWKSQSTVDFDPANMTLGKIEKLYYFLYTSTCSIAIGVSAAYWCTVHNPKIHHVDALNIMLHVVNSVLMLVDLCVMNIPVRLRNFWWSLAIVTTYIIFTVIYYSAGGSDKRGYTYIYKVLNWEKPGIALSVSIGGLTFVIIVHCLLCLITTMRERSSGRSSEKYSHEPIPNPTNEQTMKSVEIV